MGAQNGKDFLIKVDMSGAGQFVTLAGLRASVTDRHAPAASMPALRVERGGATPMYSQ